LSDRESKGRAPRRQQQTGNTETITQSGVANLAGQGQGDNGNVATITQTGGAGNSAIQNQGLLPTQTGFMSVSGGNVVRHP
jgi:hypothetical protein